MKKVVALSVLALTAVALVACGSSSNSSTTAPSGGKTGAAQKGSGGQAGAAGGASTLQLAADPSGALKFDKSSLSAKAGKVTIDFNNPAPISHDVAVEQGGKELGKSQLISQSKTSLSVNLKPGTYTFLCTVPGHAQAGMQGTLTVK